MVLPGKIGKYDVLEVLGKGATGLVYRGYDPGIKRSVAIKVITKADLEPHDLEHTIARFRQEAEAVGRLAHPRIAAIHDFIETDEIACIVMEMVNGKTLAEHLHEREQYSFKDTWEVVRQILDGLAYTHGQGVTHRDLKPGNILMNEEGRLKITDFGVALLGESGKITQHGDVVGTPHYMAPEQFQGRESTPLTDIYQVGVICYELLTGRKPFTGNNVELLDRVVNERPVNPSVYNPRITWQLDWVVQKALAKDPGERFHTARDFAIAFRGALEESLGGPLASVAAAASAAAAGGPAPASLIDKARLFAGAKDAGVLPESKSPLAYSTFTAGADAKKARVLFVDDEERILNALRTLFRNHYHVFTAENGTLALEFVKRFGIHVVVSDQRMPGMLGVEMLRQVKETSPNTVRVLLTGYSDLAAIVGSINDGEVFRFVRKPWDNHEIQRSVADAVAIAIELAAASPAPAEASAIDASIVVIDTNPDLADGLRQMLGAIAPVLLVATPEDAVKALETDEVALIIADLQVGQDALATLFKLLKAQHPEILSILVTESSDSELVIELINQAQIFRFLNKPISVHQLRSHVDSALAKYRSFKQRPDLVRSHAVTESVQAKTSFWGAKLLDRIRSLPDRLFSRQA